MLAFEHMHAGGLLGIRPRFPAFGRAPFARLGTPKRWNSGAKVCGRPACLKTRADKRRNAHGASKFHGTEGLRSTHGLRHTTGLIGAFPEFMPLIHLLRESFADRLLEVVHCEVTADEDGDTTEQKYAAADTKEDLRTSLHNAALYPKDARPLPAEFSLPSRNDFFQLSAPLRLCGFAGTN